MTNHVAEKFGDALTVSSHRVTGSFDAFPDGSGESAEHQAVADVDDIGFGEA
jgi:hypothetical protein